MKVVGTEEFRLEIQENNPFGSYKSPSGTGATEGGEAMLEFFVALQSRLMALREEDGATAAEYGLLVALIAVVIIAAVQLLGTNISSVFNEVANAI